MHRLILVLVVSLLLVSAAPRAEQPQAPAEPASEASTRPDEQAYLQASGIKPPEERLRALKQFVADWPGSQRAFTARSLIIDLSLDAIALSAKDVVAADDANIAEIHDERQLCLEHFVLAFRMFRRNVLLDLAERHARTALSRWDKPGTPDLPAVEGKSLTSADVQGLLGQILFKLGRKDEAEPLLRVAYERGNAYFGLGATSLPYLADIALERGRESDALTYLTEMELNGTMPAARRDQFRALYRKAHGGSLETLDRQLDQRYAKTHPRLAVEPYHPGKSRTGRAVLAEVFTGSSCGPCVGVDRAFDAVIDRYERQDVVVLMHHVHVPAPDPLANRANETREKFYGFEDAPRYFIDGVQPTSAGGGTADEAAAILSKGLEPALQDELAKRPDARLSLRVSTRAGSVRVAVTADHIKQPSSAIRLHVALVENQVRYVGRNGVRFHAMVVRAMAGDGAGMALKGRTSAEHVFDLAKVTADLEAYLDDYEAHRDPPGYKFDEKKSRIDATRLAVVAFLQDASSKHVLQAASAPVR